MGRGDGGAVARTMESGGGGAPEAVEDGGVGGAVAEPHAARESSVAGDLEVEQGVCGFEAGEGVGAHDEGRAGRGVALAGGWWVVRHRVSRCQ